MDSQIYIYLNPIFNILFLIKQIHDSALFSF